MVSAALEAMLENLFEGAYVVDVDRRIVDWNRAAEEITGFSREEVVGRHCADAILRHVDGEGKMLCFDGCPLQQTLADGEPREEQVYLHHREGQRKRVTIRVVPLTDDSGDIIGAVEMFRDTEREIEQQERIAALEEMVFIDPLTGLANRRYLMAQIQNRLDELRRYDWPFGVLFLDVDNFKTINDTYGHDVGDQVLKMVAATLQSATRAFDIVARYGGEEFVVITRNVGEAQLTDIAERFRKLVSLSALRDPQEIGVTISVGATLAARDDTPEDLLKRADRNLYNAKRAGRNSIYT